MSYTTSHGVVLHATGAGTGQHRARAADPPIHPSAMRNDMPQFFMLSDQRPIEHVPRPPRLSPPQESIEAITFYAHGWPGVRVKDILKNTVVVDSPNDLVFEERGWRATILHLEWPGYDPVIYHNLMHQRIDVRPNGGYMSRQDFATRICFRFLNFHKHVSEHPIAPGWEQWALTSGLEGIRVRDVVLLSAHYYTSVWVPEFYVIR
ncbi:hypothetical protein L210DRAFT_865775 [Boletus edulis BED1]|uniref:Uncharacterized protein n=1 Tax=Boletus edulis BED1 TaxID=1328754 RepID=A0AAD4G7V4_BOLED|nr:hypothetical protein L210DRAFT_865775 [Boletus edulis BED1]